MGTFEDAQKLQEELRTTKLLLEGARISLRDNKKWLDMYRTDLTKAEEKLNKLQEELSFARHAVKDVEFLDSVRNENKVQREALLLQLDTIETLKSKLYKATLPQIAKIDKQAQTERSERGTIKALERELKELKDQLKGQGFKVVMGEVIKVKQ